MTFGSGSEQEFVSKLTQITLDHLENEHFGGRELALAMGMNRSTLHRKMQSIAAKPISQFIREIRLKKAFELLQDDNLTAAEVAYRVGFGSPAYFSKCFHDFFGYPPGEVKKKLAEEYLQKYISMSKDDGASEAVIQTRLGWIYEEAEMNEKAEEHHRKAFLLEPENPWRLANLAYLLIEKELNADEGMELIEKRLEMSPDNYTLLYVKGRGLYKQGKYPEALEILQKSWDIRRELAVYDHEAFLHLEEAKKAVAISR